MGKIFGEDARRIAAAFVSLSALGNVMTVSFSDARVDQELAKEGMLPFSRFWASNWPCGAPTASLFLMFLFTFAFIVVIPFGKSPSIPPLNYTELIRRRIQLHPRRNGLPYRPRRLRRHSRTLPPPQTSAAPRQTIQSLASPRVLLPCRPSIPHHHTFHPSQRWKRRYKFTVLACAAGRDFFHVWWGDCVGGLESDITELGWVFVDRA
jgi:hypothetical protein